MQLCGDAHLSNFGAFASPDRELVFDVNDFDETLPGPWEWDVMRLAASFSVAGRASGFKRRERLAIVAAMAAEYRGAMRRMAEIGNLEVWYTKMDVRLDRRAAGAPRPARKSREPSARNLEKTQAKDRMRALSKLTREVDGELRIVSEPPLIVPVDELVRRGAQTSKRASRRSSPTTATRFPRTAASCSTATASSTRRSRWSASAASAPAPSSC